MQRIEYLIRIDFSLTKWVDDSSGSGSKDACAVGAWQESSECDAECGPGNRILERQYLNQDLAEGAGCEAELVRTVPCRGNCANKNGGGNVSISMLNNFVNKMKINSDDVEETTQPSCSFTAWTRWGPCSPNCGNGYQTRTRQYVDENRRRCEVTEPNRNIKICSNALRITS